MKTLVVLFLLAANVVAFAQPNTLWTNIFGGSARDVDWCFQHVIAADQLRR